MDWGITTKMRPDMWGQYFVTWFEPDIFFYTPVPGMVCSYKEREMELGNVPQHK